MHRIDSYNAGPGGSFLDEDPGIPRDATALTPRFMQALQEEIAKTIEGAGLTLRAGGEADESASYASQLLEAIRRIIGRARAHVQWDGAGGVTLVSGHGVTAVSLAADKVILTLATPYAAPGGGRPAQVTILRPGGSVPAVSAGDVTATGSDVWITTRLSDGSVFNPTANAGSMVVTLAY